MTAKSTTPVLKFLEVGVAQQYHRPIVESLSLISCARKLAHKNFTYLCEVINRNKSSGFAGNETII
jgi:hypothetical protein